MNAPTLTPGVAAGVAAAGALLPLAGPDGMLAAALLSQGLAFWTNYASKMAAGTLTIADAEEAAVKLDTSMQTLAADIAALPDQAPSP